ncbi:unnamed protein product, partial [Ixodes hexagonus]
DCGVRRNSRRRLLRSHQSEAERAHALAEAGTPSPKNGARDQRPKASWVETATGVASLRPGRAAAVAILTMLDGRRRRLAAILCSCRSTFLNLDTLNFCRDRNLRLSPPKTCGRLRSLLVLASDLDSPRQRWQLGALTFLQNAILNASGFQALQENLTKSFIERVPQSTKRSLMAQLGKKLGYRLSGTLKQTAQLLAFKRDTTRKLKMFSDCLQKSLELISSLHRNRLVQLKCIHDALALSAQQRKQDGFFRNGSTRCNANASRKDRKARFHAGQAKIGGPGTARKTAGGGNAVGPLEDE